MSRRFPLQSLLDLSQLRLDEATRQLGELIAGEQQATKRMELLSDYREEYRARFVAAAQSGLSPREWQNYRDFLGRLDDAIAQAESAVSQTKQRTAAGQKEWLDRRGRVKAFDTLSDRHSSRMAHQEERREQKLNDELASRRHESKDKE